MLRFYLQRYIFSVKHRKLCSKSRTFAKPFRWQSFRGIKESALLLVKSPNLYKEYARHGAAHIRGLPIRVVYSGVWRYLQENTVGSPLSLTINIVKSPSWLSAENSCKIRHYEQCNYVDKHSHAVLLCLLRIFACTEKKPQHVAMVLKLLAKWFYRTYSACLFTNFRV